jgi:hypothetical protein
MRGMSLLPILWIVIGIVVAATHHFFDHVGTIGAILSAILAVIVWPLILLGVKIAIAI